MTLLIVALVVVTPASSRAALERGYHRCSGKARTDLGFTFKQLRERKVSCRTGREVMRQYRFAVDTEGGLGTHRVTDQADREWRCVIRNVAHPDPHGRATCSLAGGRRVKFEAFS